LRAGRLGEHPVGFAVGEEAGDEMPSNGFV
jgi:hypothetical protein